MTPLAILSLGALIPGVAAAAAAILRPALKRERIYACWLDPNGRVVKSGPFDSAEKAVAFQKTLRTRGIPSMGLAQKIDGSLDRMNPVSVMRPRLGDAAGEFDTTEEQLKITSATTRLPEPEWARRAQEGPYPDTRLPREEVLPMVPLFHETTSSHEWKTDVVPGEREAGAEDVQREGEVGY
jgi:hypothetical protein